MSNSFLDKHFHQSADEQSQEAQPIIEETPTQEEVAIIETSLEVHEEVQTIPQSELEEQSFTTFFIEDEDTQPSQTPVLETKVQDKVKYNLKEYVDTNGDILEKYFKYKNLDIDQMSNEDLIRQKLKIENPTWSKSHVDAELRDSYGIGLTEVQLPEDEYSSEYQRALSHNERVQEAKERGERKLISDVLKAKQLLESEKSQVLSLPEVELDVELTANPQKFIEEYNNQLVEQNNKFLEEVWRPNISQSVEKLGGFKQSIELGVIDGDKVVSDFSYKFTEAQKQELTSYLNDYQAHPSDSMYIKNAETGEVDFTRFVSDKAFQLFAKDIIKSAVKELTAQTKQKFVKEELVNFQDTPKRVATPNEGAPKDFAISSFEAYKQKVDSYRR